ncbi:HD-GYP domain-containing protein [Alteribacillus sp. HJP-4]|uniref:HD-GYP domain-containing protein n=1 Tax=Alteribacillus sp. HJP-4 TaxID=2775394 RepID=UPI0035CCCD6C
MRVKREQLQEGCVITEDIYVLSTHPIIRRKTVLNQVHLNVLHAFLVKEASVEKKLINGEPFLPETAENTDENAEEHAPVFIENYLNAVGVYKSMFQKWQAGNPVDMGEIRRVMTPLLQEAVGQSNHVLFLHHFCTKKDYLYHHAVATGLLAAMLAHKMKFSNKEVLQAGMAGVLSDAGMAMLAPAIIEKKGELTQSEYQEVKNHPYHSYTMLKGTSTVTELMLIAVLQHHEREDGNGYPFGTSSSKLNKISRILAAADVYHAMTSERPYRKKQSPYKVIDEMLKGQFGKLHLEVVHSLMEKLLTFSIGTKVSLSNGKNAEIIFTDRNNPTSPIVKLDESQEIIQLSTSQPPFLEEIRSV